MKTDPAVTEPKPTPESPSDPRPTRRRLTPEQRIAERKAEIAAIEEKQRQCVRESIDELVHDLRAAQLRAADAGMTAEATRIHGALEALTLEDGQ